MAEDLSFKPPQILSDQTQKWCEVLTQTYEFKAHHLKLLQVAAETWDLYLAARRFLSENGMTFQDRFGQPCSRPEVAIMRDAKLSFVRIVRELNLPGQDLPENSKLEG